MATATLTIDLDAVVANWRALDASSAPHVETAAVVKAWGYGLDSYRISQALAQAGAQSFFVATLEEATRVRKAVGSGADIYGFAGLSGDPRHFWESGGIPLLNSLTQVQEFLTLSPDARFGLQIDTGMNRLGMEVSEFHAALALLSQREPVLIISHLACADDPANPMNAEQLGNFRAMTEGLNCRRSLAATGGVLLGPDYHFDLCRPGVGLYGGAPFVDAQSVITLSLPVIQTRQVLKGEFVGYGKGWRAKRPTTVATVGAGYADGILRAIGKSDFSLWHDDTPCPNVGRISMDLITVDVTDLDEVPETLDLINTHQTIEDLACAGDTIGYEILTSLGSRYERVYIGG